MQVSDAGDPGLAFTLYFPLVVALQATVGVKFMWSIIMCEWSNMILKWILAGDRPYWWIHETSLYKDRFPPFLYQFPRTCETGPGMPSGHTKLNAAMLYILVSAFIDRVLSKMFFLSVRQRAWARRGLWASYCVWMTLVVLARTYMAAHFPHQCVAGGVLGLAIAVVVWRSTRLEALTRRQYLALSGTIIATVLGTFYLQMFMGHNVLWSLEKAVKWCVKQEYIHLDTTPLYSFCRYSGVSLGLGLALSSSMYKRANTPKFSKKMVASLLVLNLAVSQVGVLVHQSLPPTMMGWYPAEFTLHTTVTFLLVAALPHFVRTASGVPAAVDRYKRK
ncbi:glucose-6-phosphatase catalytic subunit 1-like [Cherax quadricarinatus]